MGTVTFALIGLLIATPAVAQQRPMAEVFSERDIEIHRQCGVGHSGLNAAVESALRRNGYRIAPREHREAMLVYVNLNPVAIQGGCAISFKVEFSFIDSARAPWGQRYVLKHVICSQGVILTGPIIDLQARLRTHAAELTEICISEEERYRDR